MKKVIKPEEKEFVAPTKAEDFNGEKTIEHTYPNGSKVIFVLLKKDRIARIREGKGSDVEKANMEAGGDQAKYMTAMMAATVTIDGENVNMFELREGPMSDFISIQTSFAMLNF
ncbi:hypothetical protein LZZ85_11410 [Terrimonas sp. NA20]|uniref:Uncharacterized protein n=1 Tax=Terrimonas ginsenosidimutans TaxID=2908004 RepID=A0ABS9KRF0_9BACT|nr:hypothetical protein [Terrimonas ginsenosidimutans]MCG2614896.1 hypothetical protein [Terrimonas ginsenosidimutans]